MYSRNPSKPKFIELKPMPDQAGSRNPPSVLITIERNRTEDVVRHAIVGRIIAAYDRHRGD